MMYVRREFVRYAYLSGLLMFFGWLFNMAAQGWVYSYGEGIVIGYPAVVSTEFVSTVSDVKVKEGEYVRKGDVLITTTSQTVSNNNTALATSIAERKIDLAKLEIRKRVIEATLKSAETRENVVVGNLHEINKIAKGSYIPILTKNAAEESAFRSQMDATTLRVESDALREQVAVINSAITAADRALQALIALYDNGQVRSPIDGVVSKRTANPGTVTRPGEPLIDLFGGDRYVLAYYDVGRLYDLEIGRKVTINIGNINSKLTGTVEQINAIAPSLPPEFQSSLRPRERKQLVRIAFDKDQELPPFGSKVSVY